MSSSRRFRDSSKSSTRLDRARQQSTALRARMKASIVFCQKRHERWMGWWQRAFRTPLVGYCGWVRSRSTSICSALIALLGLVVKPRILARTTPLRNSRNRRRQSALRQLRTEPLEVRALLAAFVEASTTLDLSLNQTNENVAIVSNGSSYTLSTSNIWTGTDSANVTGNGTNTLTVTTAGLAAFDTVTINDAVSTLGTAVTFNDSVANTYKDTFVISLDDAAAGTIAFSGATDFANTASLSASTSKNILLMQSSTVRLEA